MESTRDIKGRIKSVTNIQQITKAMKMVAAARLRKAEEKANGSPSLCGKDRRAPAPCFFGDTRIYKPALQDRRSKEGRISRHLRRQRPCRRL